MYSEQYTILYVFNFSLLNIHSSLRVSAQVVGNSLMVILQSDKTTVGHGYQLCLFRCLVRTEMFVCVLPSFEGRWHGTARLFRDGRFFVAKQHFHRKVKPLLKLHRRCNLHSTTKLYSLKFKLFALFTQNSRISNLTCSISLFTSVLSNRITTKPRLSRYAVLFLSYSLFSS